MQTIFPPKLARGDVVRVVAPASSRTRVTAFDNSTIIDQRFAEMGLTLTFGEHVDENDAFNSSSIESRVDDLHAAFADPEVKAILSVIGGFSSNELLPSLDFDLIAANPKILCGYSDITALQNAIFARTGLVTYSGPHWSSFGMRDYFEPTGEWFRRVLLNDVATGPVRLAPSETWTDDLWFMNQDDRTPTTNEGWWLLQNGAASGRLIGGNLGTLTLLKGTKYMPPLTGAVLFVEEVGGYPIEVFLRNLTSLLQLPDAADVTGLLIGRFQRMTGVSREILAEVVARQPPLHGKPVIANVDFGHTSPLITYPIGGEVALMADGVKATIELIRY